MATFPFLLLACATAGTSVSVEVDDLDAFAPTFAEPVMLHAGGEPIFTEEPGYASPAWHDVNGDGKGDLVVGQFADGKLRVYAGAGDGTFAKGEWLKAGGEIAEVPGVW